MWRRAGRSGDGVLLTSLTSSSVSFPSPFLLHLVAKQSNQDAGIATEEKER
jgi:hypothetical protein